VTDLPGLLGRLAIPRLVGSPGHGRVREILRRELEQRGFVVMDHAFQASPARLVAAQVWGAAVGVLVFGILLLAPARVGAEWVVTWACAGVALLAAYPFVPALWRRNVPQRPAASLIGVRPRTRVDVWLAGHFDSKGQRLSMLWRLVAVALCVAGLLGVLGIAALRLSLGWRAAWTVLALPGAIGALLLARCRTTDDSPGAVDNATGILTVLAVLDALPPDTPVGALFLDAEELGLEGARALVRERRNLIQDAAIVNFDGIDDSGGTLLLAHRAGPVGAAVARALDVRPARFRPILVDGIELARGARECVTVLRGGLATARIVHTPRDTAARLTLAGVRQVAAAVALVIRNGRP
jgi:peptidase M28-like protein